MNDDDNDCEWDHREFVRVAPRRRVVRAVDSPEGPLPTSLPPPGLTRSEDADFTIEADRGVEEVGERDEVEGERAHQDLQDVAVHQRAGIATRIASAIREAGLVSIGRGDIDGLSIEDFCSDDLSGVVDSVQFRIDQIIHDLDCFFFSLCVRPDEYRAAQASQEPPKNSLFDFDLDADFADIAQEDHLEMSYEELIAREEQVGRVVNEASRISAELIQYRKAFLFTLKARNDQGEEKMSNGRELYQVILKTRIPAAIRMLLRHRGLFSIDMLWVVKDKKNLSSLGSFWHQVQSASAISSGAATLGMYHLGVRVGCFHSHLVDDDGTARVVNFFEKTHPHLLGNFVLRLPLFMTVPSEETIRQITIAWLLSYTIDKLVEVANDIVEAIVSVQAGMPPAPSPSPGDYVQVASLRRILRILRETSAPNGPWDNQPYQRRKRNCQHYVRDLLVRMGLWFPAHLQPTYLSVVDIGTRICSTAFYSPELMNFISSVWMNPKGISFSSLRGISGSDVNAFLPLAADIVRSQQEQRNRSHGTDSQEDETPSLRRTEIQLYDSHVLCIACEFYARRYRRSQKAVNEEYIGYHRDLLLCFAEAVAYFEKQIALEARRVEDFFEQVDTLPLPFARGASAAVYRIEYNGQPTALKRFFLPSVGESNELVEVEVEAAAKLYNRLRHPNITKLFGYVISDDVCGLLLELCDGNLKSYLRTHRGNWGLDEKIRCFLEIADSMHYFHALGIVHRDLKPENVLYVNAQRPIWKICDFAFSKELQSIRAHTTLGSTHFVAPEVLCGQEYGFSCDLFSFSVLMYQILFEYLDLHRVFYQSFAELIREPSLRPRILSLDELILRDVVQLTEDDRDEFDALVGLIQMGWAEDRSARGSFRLLVREFRSLLGTEMEGGVIQVEG